jgi:hypothetical protein
MPNRLRCLSARFPGVALTVMTTLCAGSLCGSLAQSQQGNPNPGVLPPNSRPHGQTYGEWSAAWWKWALEKSVVESPLLDTTGANCAIGQPRSVWFLFSCGECLLLSGRNL